MGEYAFKYIHISNSSCIFVVITYQTLPLMCIYCVWYLCGYPLTSIFILHILKCRFSQDKPILYTLLLIFDVMWGWKFLISTDRSVAEEEKTSEASSWMLFFSDETTHPQCHLVFITAIVFIPLSMGLSNQFLLTQLLWYAHCSLWSYSTLEISSLLWNFASDLAPELGFPRMRKF